MWQVMQSSMNVLSFQFACVRASVSPDTGMFADVYVVWQFRHTCVAASVDPTYPLSAEVDRRSFRLFA